jgi:hypothetical protein
MPDRPDQHDTGQGLGGNQPEIEPWRAINVELDDPAGRATLVIEAENLAIAAHRRSVRRTLCGAGAGNSSRRRIALDYWQATQQQAADRPGRGAAQNVLIDPEANAVPNAGPEHMPLQFTVLHPAANGLGIDRRDQAKTSTSRPANGSRWNSIHGEASDHDAGARCPSQVRGTRPPYICLLTCQCWCGKIFLIRIGDGVSEARGQHATLARTGVSGGAPVDDPITAPKSALVQPRSRIARSNSSRCSPRCSPRAG